MSALMGFRRCGLGEDSTAYDQADVLNANADQMRAYNPQGAAALDAQADSLRMGAEASERYAAQQALVADDQRYAQAYGGSAGSYAAQQTIQRTGSTSLMAGPSTFDTIANSLSSIFKSAAPAGAQIGAAYLTQQGQQGLLAQLLGSAAPKTAAPAPSPSSIPGWLLPAGLLLALGIGAAVVLRKG